MASAGNVAALRNENCLEGMQCPSCGSEGPFKIVAETCATVFDDGVDSSEDFEWDDASPCTCKACDHEGTVESFTVESPGPKTFNLDYGIRIEVAAGSGHITSELRTEFDDPDHPDQASPHADALESFLCALACEGIDLDDSRVTRALNTTVEAIANNLESAEPQPESPHSVHKALEALDRFIKTRDIRPIDPLNPQHDEDYMLLMAAVAEAKDMGAGKPGAYLVHDMLEALKDAETLLLNPDAEPSDADQVTAIISAAITKAESFESALPNEIAKLRTEVVDLDVRLGNATQCHKDAYNVIVQIANWRHEPTEAIRFAQRAIK